jgi:lysophospholipase L1-like esterase
LLVTACNPFTESSEEWIYAQTAVPPPEQRNGLPLIVATGDSIAVGWQDCRERVCQGVEYDWWQTAFAGQALVLARGIGSSTTQDLLERWEQDTQGAELVIILTGVNDIAREMTASTILTNLESMHQRAAQAGIIPIFCTIMPADSSDSPSKLAQVEAVNAELRRKAEEEGWWVIDLHAAMADPATGYLRRSQVAHPGSAHPNQAGYDQMAEVVRAWWLANRDQVWPGG